LALKRLVKKIKRVVTVEHNGDGAVGWIRKGRGTEIARHSI